MCDVSVHVFSFLIRCNRTEAPIVKSKKKKTAYYNSSAVAPTLATRSCASMPNVNEMSWYCENGDVHWDNTEYWSNSGGTTLYTGGIWMMKKAAIIAAGLTFSSTMGATGGDMRVNAYPYSKTVEKNGKPTNVDNYFFLPAAGWYYYVNGASTGVFSEGRYWTASPYPGNNAGAFGMSFVPDTNGNYELNISSQNRNNGILAGSQQWFQ